MLSCFTHEAKNAIPIFLVSVAEYAQWLNDQPSHVQQWLNSSKFKQDIGALRLIPDTQGKLASVIVCVSDKNHFYEVAGLSMQLPEGIYYFALAEADTQRQTNYILAWGLGSYQFSRYKKATRLPAQLVIDKQSDAKNIMDQLAAIYLVRDLINTPADDMGPSQLADATQTLASAFNASYTAIVGDDLITKNYPAIYTVGRASDDAPRLLDLRWGDASKPKVTLVGKGVCFDTGGLDVKPSSAMLLMKKDMAGAANVLGLAHMIMAAQLPIYLRVLIPAVENAIAGNAYRPGDVITSRSGKTIEIGNTDAEGRVVLADALTEAVAQTPDLIIDMATLTGAARVALGTDLPAVFGNNEAVMTAVLQSADRVRDPMWRLPLYAPYREYINSAIADINNNSSEPYAGAITAALFLQDFVPANIPWLHFDMMAWNTRARPGKPQGGEAMAIRALFHYLHNRYQ